MRKIFILLARTTGIIAGLFLVTACEEKTDRAEARKYQELIAEKHDLLGRAIILQGRLIESFNLNDDILDDVKFMDAEGYLEGLLEQIGPVKDIESMALPTQDPELQKLHSILADAVYFLNECNRSLDDTAYTTTAYAEAAWGRARLAFGNFTQKLVFLTTGETLPDIEAEKIPEYTVGDSLRKTPIDDSSTTPSP